MPVEIFLIIKPTRFTGPLAEECGNAALFVGKARQRRNQDILSSDRMLHLHRVAYRINIGYGSFHPIVDNNAALQSQRTTGLLCKASVWGNADCQHHHIGMKRRLILQQDIHTAVFLLEALYGIPQRQLYTMPTHFSHDRVCLSAKISTGVYCVNKIVCRTTVLIWISIL